MRDIADLCLIRVSFTCLKAAAFDDNAGVNRYTGRHVTPITIAIGLQSQISLSIYIYMSRI